MHQSDNQFTSKRVNNQQKLRKCDTFVVLLVLINDVRSLLVFGFGESKRICFLAANKINRLMPVSVVLSVRVQSANSLC